MLNYAVLLGATRKTTVICPRRNLHVEKEPNSSPVGKGRKLTIVVSHRKMSSEAWDPSDVGEDYSTSR